MHTWRNWSGLETSTAHEVVTPGDSAAVAALVCRAVTDGRRVKMIGTGHSFTAISAPDDIMVLPHGMTGILSVDRAAMTVTAAAGTPLHVLNHELARLGLSLHNMGDIAEQTLAGAISTGTHGTGGVHASLSAQVSGLEVVTGTGEVLELSRRQHPDVFAAARLGLGALGIITEVTFDVEPLGVLEAHEQTLDWAEGLARYDAFVADNHHVDAYWFPYTDRIQVKANNRLDLTPAEAEPLSDLRTWIDDDLVDNRLFGLVNRLGNARPSLVPRLNRMAARLLSERRYSDVPHKVFTTPRAVVFKEMEYAVPREAGLTALREVRERIERSTWPVGFPVEIRHTPADDLPLGTSSGRESIYLAFHVNARADHRHYFAAMEEIMVAHGGRPHWGKVHTRTAGQLAEVYPQFEEFLALRDRLDPHRVFTNPYLRRVLG